MQYEEEYSAGTDHVLLWADIPAAPTRRRQSKRAIFKYHRAPIISDLESREAYMDTFVLMSRRLDGLNVDG